MLAGERRGISMVGKTVQMSWRREGWEFMSK